jgi:Zn-dependent protease with chaperone function
VARIGYTILTWCQGFGFVPVSIFQIHTGSYNKRKQSTVFRCALLHYKPRLLRALLLQNAGLNIFLMLRKIGSKFVTVRQRSKN